MSRTPSNNHENDTVSPVVGRTSISRACAHSDSLPGIQQNPEPCPTPRWLGLEFGSKLFPLCSPLGCPREGPAGASAVNQPHSRNLINRPGLKGWCWLTSYNSLQSGRQPDSNSSQPFSEILFRPGQEEVTVLKVFLPATLMASPPRFQRPFPKAPDQRFP